MRSKGLEWFWGLAEQRKLDAGGGWGGKGGGGGGGRGTQAMGAGGPAGGPCGVLYGRIRDEEEEGLGDIGSSSNHLKWSRDSWELHS